VTKMPKVEKAIHLDAFKLYVAMGGMSPEFLAQFGTEIGKSARTAKRWESELDWQERAKQPAAAAVAELEQAEKLDAQELISGFLDLCEHRLESVGIQKTYIDAIFATAFARIPTPVKPNPENPLAVKTIEDMDKLVNMQVKYMREEQAWTKLALLLVGEPDSRNETTIRIIDVLREGRAKNDGS